MYCRTCGKTIGDTDHFCQFCGSPSGYTEPSQAPTEAEEEIIFNPPYEEKSHSVKEEGLKEFISEHELEEVQQKEVRKKEEEPEPVKAPEFTWNVYEFPTEKKKTEEVEFNWNMEEYSQSEQKSTEAAAFEEELFREIRHDSNRAKEQDIDRFFTFSRKSEEFQELLDKEYEKFKMRNDPLADEPRMEIMLEPEVPEENVEIPEENAEIPEEAFYEEPAFDPEMPMEEITSEAEPEPEIELMPEAKPDEEPEAEAIPEPDHMPKGEAIQEPELRAEHLSEMELARAKYFGEDSSQRPIEDKETENIIKAPAVSLPVKEEHEGVMNSRTVEVITEEAGSRWSAGQIALIVIAVILVIEIGILGIRYAAPDSSAAKAIGDVQTRVFNTVSGWFEKDNSKAPENVPDDQEQMTQDNDPTGQESVQQEDSSGNTAPIADPAPMTDKNALVSTQMGNNKNIEKIKANDTLAWQQGKNYGFSDINNSKPITNNIWRAPENGDPVYYDRAVVGAVITFDSQWIDFVNRGDKSVLTLLKKDSEAYRKTVYYSKIGMIKETFKLLEIGEIRQGSNGFYIWVHEEIGATEDGKSKVLKYNWIYYLEPDEGQMKIVNYYHY